MKGILVQVALSTLLLSANILLAVSVVKNGTLPGLADTVLRKAAGDFLERRLQREIRRYSRSVSVKMSLMERMELFYIDKSNIRRILPFMNAPILLLFMLLVFATVLGPVYRVLLFLPSAAVISLLFAMIPLFTMDLMARYNSEKIRRHLAEFISVLNRWCAVKEDIFYAFEKSIEAGIGEPLKTFIKDMVIQVNRGIEPLEALNILQMKVDNAQFRDFVINIKQSIRHRGDIRRLLENLEAQFYKIEEEYNRRRISTYRDRVLIYFVMFAVLLTGYCFIKLNPRIEEYYFFTLQGKSLLTLFSVLYAGGFYLSFGITKFKH